MNYILIAVAVVAIVLLISGFLFWKWRSLNADFRAREEELKNFRISLRPGSQARFLEMNGEVVKRNGAKVVFRLHRRNDRIIHCKATDLEPPR